NNDCIRLTSPGFTWSFDKGWFIQKPIRGIITNTCYDSGVRLYRDSITLDKVQSYWGTAADVNGKAQNGNASAILESIITDEPRTTVDSTGKTVQELEFKAYKKVLQPPSDVYEKMKNLRGPFQQLAGLRGAITEAGIDVLEDGYVDISYTDAFNQQRVRRLNIVIKDWWDLAGYDPSNYGSREIKTVDDIQSKCIQPIDLSLGSIDFGNQNTVVKDVRVVRTGTDLCGDYDGLENLKINEEITKTWEEKGIQASFRLSEKTGLLGLGGNSHKIRVTITRTNKLLETFNVRPADNSQAILKAGFSRTDPRVNADDAIVEIPVSITVFKPNTYGNLSGEAHVIRQAALEYYNTTEDVENAKKLVLLFRTNALPGTRATRIAELEKLLPAPGADGYKLTYGLDIISLNSYENLLIVDATKITKEQWDAILAELQKLEDDKNALAKAIQPISLAPYCESIGLEVDKTLFENVKYNWDWDFFKEDTCSKGITNSNGQADNLFCDATQAGIALSKAQDKIEAPMDNVKTQLGLVFGSDGKTVTGLGELNKYCLLSTLGTDAEKTDPKLNKCINLLNSDEIYKVGKLQTTLGDKVFFLNSDYGLLEGKYFITTEEKTALQTFSKALEDSGLSKPFQVSDASAKNTTKKQLTDAITALPADLENKVFVEFIYENNVEAKKASMAFLEELFTDLLATNLSAKANLPRKAGDENKSYLLT
ncbi:MAG: hypothetical protein Q7K43_03785, partial [Candidatus Woesearchaeota archaeon]|nr:hypothetical protein [Candidatus Woesearchaeota archaeon]